MFAFYLMIVKSSGITEMMSRVQRLVPYFSLPPDSATEQDKREHEIVRLLVLGIAGEVDIDELA